MCTLGLQGELLSEPIAEDKARRRSDGGFSVDHDNQDDLYAELWHACAGPHIYIPRVGENVLYFPQGHVEQVEAYIYQDGVMEMPIYDLPSKILCKVVHVQLKVEAHTDEVFAQVTLLPETEQDELNLENENALSSPQRASASSFVKILTPSDTSKHGGLSVPKRHADECFPPLDMSEQPPAQVLVTEDLQGCEWHFRHIYRGQPKRHLLTSGWSTFVAAKRLAAGDACIFLRGENGKLRVGICRAIKQLNNSWTSVISGYSMQHGILASAFHAVSTGTIFTVYYHPWTSPSKFILPFSQYIRLAESIYSVGTRFRMQIEGEACSEKRHSGTVVGIEDIDHIRWPGSEWRCLKVQWDTTSDTFVPPGRVSPWDIKLIESTNNTNNPTTMMLERKRMRPIIPSSPGFSSLIREGVSLSPVKYTSKRNKMVLQGQEERETKLGAQTPAELPHLTIPADSNWDQRLLGLENQLCLPMHDQFYRCDRNTVSSPGGNIVAPCPTYQWRPIFTRDGVIKHGSALGRSVDLVRFKGYVELIAEFDQMFDFKGSLIDGSSGWQITYMDDEGDLMLIGDHPWQLRNANHRLRYVPWVLGILPPGAEDVHLS
ncbi:Auxin response factor 2 [Morella rubra]|uniref:Auxin response factor n=1 Tax=Morella rubra TaxID=262757 RepID=A0A6A1UFX7_9ROSI|nr:Auxin response factor 2 [Morella rubra]